MVTHTATSLALYLLIEPSAFTSPPLQADQAARQISGREASISVIMLASLKAMASFMMMGRPKARRSFAYSDGLVGALAMPRAWAPTVGRVASNVDHRRSSHGVTALAGASQLGVELLLAASRHRPGSPHVVQHDLGRLRGPDCRA